MQQAAAPAAAQGTTTGTPELKDFLDAHLVARGADPVTGAADLCAHARIAPLLRDAALNLVGASDVFKKVKPPGDTTLYTNAAWSLESLAAVQPSGAAAAAAVDPAQLAAAFSLPPGRHALPEAARGPRVVPQSRH